MFLIVPQVGTISSLESTILSLVSCKRMDNRVVRFYYNYIFGCLTASFPWKSIWNVKGPKKALFFFMGSSSRFLQSITLLRGLPLVNWCCMCRLSMLWGNCGASFASLRVFSCFVEWSFLDIWDSMGDARKGSIFSA